jgi:hypothetical protein
VGSIRLSALILIAAIFCAPVGAAAQGQPETKLPTADAKAPVADNQALAQALAKEQMGVVKWLIGGFFFLFVLVIIGVGLLQRRFQSAVEKVIDSAKDAEVPRGEPGKDGEPPLRNVKIEALRLLQSSPVGVPEGTVRAVLSFLLIAGGMVILMLKKRLDLEGAAEIASILGTVLGFYFGSRGGTDTAAQQSAQLAVDTATRATEKAGQAQVNAQVSRTAMEATQQATIRAIESGAGGGADSQVTKEQGRLRDIRENLRTAQQIVRVVAGASSGSAVVEGGAKVIDEAEKMLGIIEPLLSGKPGLSEIAEAATKAGASLTELKKVGLPGIFGDAIATVGAVASTVSGGISTATALGGILGGPAGIVGAIVFSGLKLYQDKQKFDNWEAAVLQRPFDRNLMPTSDFENAGLLALEYAPLMRARLAAGAAQVDPALAAAVLRAVVAVNDSGAPVAAIQLAKTLRTPRNDPDLSALFATDQELAEAIEEYRQSVVFKRAKDNLPPTIDLGAAVAGVTKPIDLHAVLDLIPQLRRDGRVATEIDRLSTIVSALGGQKALPLEHVLAFVGDALREGEATAAKDRQMTETRVVGS